MVKYVYMFREGRAEMKDLLGAGGQPGRNDQDRASGAAGVHGYHRSL